jgi:hypothetical protein
MVLKIYWVTNENTGVYFYTIRISLKIEARMCCSTKFPGGSVGNIKESTVKKEQKKEN